MSTGHIDCSVSVHIHLKAKSKMFQLDMTYQDKRKAERRIFGKVHG